MKFETSHWMKYDLTGQWKCIYWNSNSRCVKKDNFFYIIYKMNFVLSVNPRGRIFMSHWKKEALHTGSAVVKSNNAIETGVKRFSQIFKKKEGKLIAHQCALGVMASKAENTFSPLHISVLVKSKIAFCHCAILIVL